MKFTYALNYISITNNIISDTEYYYDIALKSLLRSPFSDGNTGKQVVASRNCSNKKFCEEMKPDEKKCNAAKKIQEDCPVSCKKCNPCEDSEICTTLNNIKALCKYESKVRSICPKSCETCQYQDITLGIHVLKNL